MNFSSAKQQLTPPEKGSFPLDHHQECKPVMKEFLACLKERGNEHVDCKSLSKKYLACRMDKGLMAREEPASRTSGVLGPLNGLVERRPQVTT